jgi:hypothetical protein
MNLKKFLNGNWKKILIILVAIAAWYFIGSSGLFQIPGLGFFSGGGTFAAYKTCDCIGIPNNQHAIGSSSSYCVGIVANCRCFLIGYPSGDILGPKQEVDCNCPEGKYVFDWGTDACRFFKDLGSVMK